MVDGMRIRVYARPPNRPDGSIAERVRDVLGYFHAAVALVALVAGALLVNGGELALGIAALAQALVVAAYFGLVLVWLGLGTGSGGPDLVAGTTGFQKEAAGLVSLAGVVLTLVIAFVANDAATSTVKAAGVALVICALTGILLAGLVATGVHTEAQYFLASIVYSASIWTLSFGLLCLATALVFER
jgi:hypothetical protein